MKSKRFQRKKENHPTVFFFNLSEVFSKVFKNSLKFPKVCPGQVVAVCQILIKQ